MWLSYETKAAKHAAIASDCWHTIDNGWTHKWHPIARHNRHHYLEGAIGQARGNYDSHDLLGSVSVVFVNSAQARPKQALHITSY